MSDSQTCSNEVEQAIKTILSNIEKDTFDREGLEETPTRVAKALNEWFAGYSQDPKEILSKQFSEVSGYSEMILLKDISFESHCEHHMCPIIGKVHIAYIQKETVVGISKLARLVDCFAKRFQIQERFTNEIGIALYQILKCEGVAVMVEAEHFCISTRGIKKKGSSMITSCYKGVFVNHYMQRQEFLQLVNK